ncbi:MAG TPA: Mov34/MPN/PAD-1 family protein [Candidatus Bathyarchaeia archaeon]|nr:Mov34/MPN/PAD-1 family protein [Candidatus Bathyarchaeia archaeon]
MRKVKRIEGIAKDTLEFILEVCKSNHPREFIGMLCVDGDLITDIFFLPGTISSDENAIIRMDMMPTGLCYVGSVHSHPHPAATRPSEQDLLMYSKTGDYHIIACYPYGTHNWKCYNANGEERVLEIVERDLEMLKVGGEQQW